LHPGYELNISRLKPLLQGRQRFCRSGWAALRFSRDAPLDAPASDHILCGRGFSRDSLSSAFHSTQLVDGKAPSPTTPNWSCPPRPSSTW